jgi:hypothetical protein
LQLFATHFTLPKILRKKDILIFSLEPKFLRKSKSRNFLPAIILRKYKTGISPFLPNACLILSQKQKYVKPAQSSQGPFSGKMICK